MRIKIIVKKPGMFTTVQDLGRFGYQQYGMPIAGAMDSYALQAANILVGNARNEAALEITFMGFTASFSGTGLVALTGGDLGARLNGTEIMPWQSFRVSTGDELSFTAVKSGCRAYLAIQGGMDVPLVMESRATYLRAGIGGFQGRRIQKGDVLCGRDIESKAQIDVHQASKELIPDYDRRKVRVILGPQDDYFLEQEIEKLLSGEYRITNQYDRMGYRVEGPVIRHQKGPDIISDGISPGAVQIPGHGQPIIMLADCQTIGGYAKIAHVISSDLSMLAQRIPGDILSFSQVTVAEAHEYYRTEENKLRKLEVNTTSSIW